MENKLSSHSTDIHCKTRKIEMISKSVLILSISYIFSLGYPFFLFLKCFGRSVVEIQMHFSVVKRIVFLKTSSRNLNILAGTGGLRQSENANSTPPGNNSGLMLGV